MHREVPALVQSAWIELHLIEAGHFALATDVDTVADLMREFLGKHATRD